MTHAEAKEMAQLIRAENEGSSIKVEQEGGEFAGATSPWTVEIWTVNSRAGNRNLTTVRDYQPQLVAAIVRQAKGKATARDREALVRIDAEKEN